MPGYEPRSLKTMALGLAVSTRGACHNRSSAYEADFSSRRRPLRRTRIGPHNNGGRGLLDGPGLSDLVQVPTEGVRRLYAESASIYEHVTGWPMTPDDLKKAGERINNLKKLFNIREGWKSEDDTLPPGYWRRGCHGSCRGRGLCPGKSWTL